MRHPFYQTGRFAASVEPLNVTKSERGRLNVSYRYQTNPYQVFERGGALYRPQRDPRDLISLSIREIAAELKLTEVATRRIV